MPSKNDSGWKAAPREGVETSRGSRSEKDHDVGGPGRQGRGSPLPQLFNMNTTLLSPLMTCGRWPAPLRVLFLHTGFRRVGFSYFFPKCCSRGGAGLIFVLPLVPNRVPLQRWPHFRGSARSESCSRCSAGLISALPLVPNRAPAAALASCPVPCHGMQCDAMPSAAAMICTA